MTATLKFDINDFISTISIFNLSDKKLGPEWVNLASTIDKISQSTWGVEKEKISEQALGAYKAQLALPQPIAKKVVRAFQKNLQATAQAAIKNKSVWDKIGEEFPRTCPTLYSACCSMASRSEKRAACAPLPLDPNEEKKERQASYAPPPLYFNKPFPKTCEKRMKKIFDDLLFRFPIRECLGEFLKLLAYQKRKVPPLLRQAKDCFSDTEALEKTYDWLQNKASLGDKETWYDIAKFNFLDDPSAQKSIEAKGRSESEENLEFRDPKISLPKVTKPSVRATF